MNSRSLSPGQTSIDTRHKSVTINSKYELSTVNDTVICR